MDKYKKVKVNYTVELDFVIPKGITKEEEYEILKNNFNYLILHSDNLVKLEWKEC